MKSILLVANFENTNAVNGGYAQATDSIKESLLYAKNKKKIKSIDFCDFKNIRNFTNMKYDICLIVCNPNSFIKNKDVFKTSFSNCKENYLHILWETDPLPKLWDSLWDDDFLNGFFTPSNFFKTMIDKKTIKPVFFTPYAMKDFNEPIDIENKKEEKNFTILVMGQNTTRKGIKDAVTSYIRTFAENDSNKSVLLLKCFQLSEHEVSVEEMVINQIKLNTSSSTKNCKIYNITKELDRKEIFDLYSKSSLLLSTSRGEGFNLPAIEAMSIGLPIIYVNWSNTPEVVNPNKEEDNINIPLDYYLDEAIDMKHYGYEYGTSYAIPFIRDIMNALALKYNEWMNSKENYYKESKKNIKIIKDNFSIEKINEYYMELFENIKG